MNLQKLLFLWLTLFLSCTSLIAQETVSTSGGNATGSGGTASYTVGQVVYTQQSSTSGSVMAGVQQAYEITVVNSIAEAINFSVTVYPNPTTDFLQLKVESEKFKELSYQLNDMQGKLLQNKKLTEIETQIDMSSFVSAIYFLKIIHNNIEIKKFKIVKL